MCTRAAHWLTQRTHSCRRPQELVFCLLARAREAGWQRVEAVLRRLVQLDPGLRLSRWAMLLRWVRPPHPVRRMAWTGPRRAWQGRRAPHC